MYVLETLTGRLIEARRYLNRIPDLRDDDPSRERWELWLADASNHECWRRLKFDPLVRIVPTEN